MNLSKFMSLDWEIFLIAFFIRIFAIIFLTSYYGIQLWEYEAIANNILKGLGYSYEHLGTIHYAFGPPLYAFFSALIYYLTNHSQLIVLIIQALFSAITCVLIFKISKNIFDYRTGLLASFLVVFHPGIILYVTKLHSLTIDVLLFTLIFLTLLMAKDKFSLKYFIILGVIVGLCLFSRTTIFFFIIPAFIFLYTKTNEKKKLLKYFSLTFLIAFLIISPWLIRNYLLLNRFVFVQKSGEVFWRGNNPNATGNSYTIDGKVMIDSASKDFLKKIYNSNEIEQDRLFWKEAFRFIKSHPLKFTMLTIKKFYYFWWFSPHSGIEYPKLYLSIYKVLYSFGLFFSIFGIFSALQSKIQSKKKNAYLLLLLFISISLIQSLFYVEGRHRWAIEPLFLMFTANGLIYIKDRINPCLKTKI